VYVSYIYQEKNEAYRFNKSYLDVYIGVNNRLPHLRVGRGCDSYDTTKHCPFPRGCSPQQRNYFIVLDPVCSYGWNLIY